MHAWALWCGPRGLTVDQLERNSFNKRERPSWFVRPHLDMSDPTRVDCLPGSSTDVTSSITTPFQVDVIDSNTFAPPNLKQDTSGEELPKVVIEFCDRCRW